MQQYLPLAVLKRQLIRTDSIYLSEVATVLTACGIETSVRHNTFDKEAFLLQQYLPLAVLKLASSPKCERPGLDVATVLTACGIETYIMANIRTQLVSCNSTYRLRY